MLFYLGTEFSYNKKDEAILLSYTIENYLHILLMYLVHALPYTQSAFNWLFYAFLNRNLRQSVRWPTNTRTVLANIPLDSTNCHSNYPCNNIENYNNYRTEIFQNLKKKSNNIVLPFWNLIGNFSHSNASKFINNSSKNTCFLFKPKIKSRLVCINNI